jgi:predicted nucleic acid-binding protein
VKLYADEDGHEPIRRLRAPLVISALARVEVIAAIWRKHRAGELDIDDSLTLIRAFRVDYAGARDTPVRFLTVAVTEEILERATEMAGAHGLRAYDAVQLASALAARDVDERCATLTSFDRDLTAAAVSEGFKTLPAASKPSTSARGRAASR